MKKTVKVQKAGTNTTISLPKDFAEKLIWTIENYDEAEAFQKRI